MNDDSIRLNKFISDSGHCSRREADKLIEAGQVRLNGQRPETGSRVFPGDTVEVQGQLIRSKKPKDITYIAYNKPEGITCTTEQSVKGNIVDAVNYGSKIFPIGRLDKFSSGLIFLTNDGDIVNKILRAGNSHEKEYIVTVDKPINDEFIRKMGNGIPILDTVTQKCPVFKEGKFAFRIILKQGLNRQIRRMCEYLGYRVQTLQRIRIMNVNLGKLKPGSWRNLSPAEMAEINKSIANSSNTKEASRDSNKGQQRSFKKKPSVPRKDERKNSNSRPQKKSSNNRRGPQTKQNLQSNKRSKRR